MMIVWPYSDEDDEEGEWEDAVKSAGSGTGVILLLDEKINIVN